MLIFYCYRSEEANKAFSAGVQMHDTLVKAWALWGDFLEQIFTKVFNQHGLEVDCSNTCGLLLY